MTGDRDLLEAFLVEGRELLARGADELARAADDPAAGEALFRTLHTLKGATALFELSALTDVLHTVESGLEARRGGLLAEADLSMATAALDLVDTWIDALAGGGGATPELLRRTRALARRLAGSAMGAGQAGPDREPVVDAVAEVAEWAAALADGHLADTALMAIRYRPPADAYFRGEDPLAVLRAIPGLRALRIGLEPSSGDRPYDPFRCRLTAEALSDASLAEVRAALRLAASDVEIVRVEGRGGRSGEPEGPRAGAATVRVSATQIDAVASLSDDLLAAGVGLRDVSERLAQVLPGHPLLRELERRQADMARASAALHRAVAGLRLVSLRGLFMRFPRHVREAAARLGKRVDFETSGADVALDKATAEALFEPLLHLLRNAVDHGVETPAARLAAGKPPTARIRLAASTVGDRVFIEVSDDGQGVDPAAVAAAALSRGLIDLAAAEALDGPAAAALLFTPGFSTRDEAGELSGRGVGMDAVREAVERLGGRVDLDSRMGEGLRVTLRLAARSVLTRLLVVEASGRRFGVPLSTVATTHHVRADEVTAIRAGRAYARGDTVLPIVRLATLLDLETVPDPARFPVLVLAGGAEPVGVQVDAVGRRVEAPLRPLEGLLEGTPGLLGGVLEADGRVLLVLDLAELAA